MEDPGPPSWPTAGTAGGPSQPPDFPPVKPGGAAGDPL